jgi:hypothetical protein
VIGSSSLERPPISRFSEYEARHLYLILAHWGVAIGRSVQVEIYQFLEVCAHDLVRVDEDDLIEVYGEQVVEEDDFGCPNDTLLFALLSQPCRPPVGDELVLETVFLSKVRDELLCKALDGSPLDV